jgi:regulator of cell morphogenesis and NO signaling
MAQTFNGLDKVGEIVAIYPGASNLFKANSIDFCCGGNRTLESVLRKQGIEESEFLAELNASFEEEGKRTLSREIDWLSEPSAGLIDHVVHTHHAYIQKELPLLSEFTTKVLRVHGQEQGAVLSGLHRLFHTMKLELEQHLISEEEQIFPLIKQYEREPSEPLRAQLAEAIEQLESEHSGVGELLKQMRAITSGYTLPEGACRTYTLTYQKLELLEEDLFRHIHLENNILFPRYVKTA